MANGFPLLRLPSELLTNVLRTMDVTDQLSLSFVSRKTKSLVTSLNLRAQAICIPIFRLLRLTMTVNNTYLIFDLCREDRYGRFPVEVPGNVIVNVDTNDLNQMPMAWNKAGYGVRDWIDHLMSVTRQSHIFKLQFQSDIFDVSSAKKTFQGLDISYLEFGGSVPMTYLGLVCEAVQAENLRVSLNSVPTPKPIRKALMQNYRIIYLDSGVKLNLDDLLLTNCQVISVYAKNVEVDPKMWNKFIKLWKTGFNPKLERLSVEFLRRFNGNLNDFMRGIKHVATPDGCVIKGDDGREARISFKNNCLEMKVFDS